MINKLGNDKSYLELFLYHLKILKNVAINKYLILSSNLNIEETKKIKEEICKQLITFKKIIEDDKIKINNKINKINIENINISLTSLIENKQNLRTKTPLYVLDEEDEEDDLSGGRKPTKYKSTGNAVFIMYKKKKYKRTIYVKDKTNTKYCKINNEYILLSKLKVL